MTCIECGNSWQPEPILKSKQTLSFDSAKTEDEKSNQGDLENNDDIDIDADNDDASEDSKVDIGGDDEDDISEVVVEERKEDN